MPKYVPLNPTDKTALTSIEVRSAFPQDEVFIVAKNPGASAALGGGLIGAIIDSQVAKSRQNDIQAIVEPFYASVDDVDYRTTFWTSMTPQLQSSFAGQIQSIKNNPAAGDFKDAKKAMETLKPGQGLMIVHTRYSFTDNFSNLITSTAVDLYRSGDTKPVFSNIYNVHSKSATGNSIADWSASGGQAYRQAVTESAKEVATMLALDLAHPRINDIDQGLNTELGATTQSGYSALGLMNMSTPAQVKGPILDQRNDRLVVRNTDGRLWSVPR